MRNNFLVIGSNSFSGAYFIKYLLEKGHNVIGISRSEEPNKVFLPYKWSGDLANNFEFVQLDLNSNLGEIIDLVTAQQPDYIVNFAAQGMVAESWLNPEHWYQTNVVSQVKLHNELRKLDFILEIAMKYFSAFQINQALKIFSRRATTSNNDDMRHGIGSNKY